jgi:hypothetical protein
MKSKRYFYAILAVLLILSFVTGSFAQPLTPDEKEQLKWLFGTFETFVSQGNSQGIIDLFSPNMPQDRRDYLTNEVYGRIASGGVRLSFFPDLSDKKIVEIEPGMKYQITGRFNAEGPNWNLSGLKATFTVERVGYYFYIYDTDIFDKMSLKGAGKVVGAVFLIIGLVFLLFVGGVVLIVVLIVRSQKKKTVGSGGGPGTV